MIKIFMVICVIFINLYVLKYINDLEKSNCECSQNWKKKYIKYYALITLGVVTIYYVLPLTLKLFLPESLNFIGNSFAKVLKSNQLIVLLELYLIFGLVNIFLIFKFTKEIKNSKCGCDDTLERQVLYYYSIVIIVIYIFSFLISTDLYISNNLNNKKIKVIK